MSVSLSQLHPDMFSDKTGRIPGAHRSGEVDGLLKAVLDQLVKVDIILPPTTFLLLRLRVAEYCVTFIDLLQLEYQKGILAEVVRYS
ncbi:hypothetical protein J6590_079113 [Homalodisca vitripennis]|nr:hypothetical protein J6590_079113 [Homalodisca vitripennis]